MRFIICDIDGTFADSSHRNTKLPAYTGKFVSAAHARHGLPAGTPGQIIGREEREDCSQSIVTVRWLGHGDCRGSFDQPYLWNDFMKVTSQDWIDWHADIASDKPIENICWLFRALRSTMLGEDIAALWLTSRWETSRQATTAWLQEQRLFFPGDWLEMRQDGDVRKDALYKGEVLDRYEAAGHSFMMAFEDRLGVANYLRGRGIQTMHTQDYQ